MEELIIEDEILQPIGSFCMWCDLLGFGEPFIKSNWNLTTEDSKKNILRILRLYQIMTFPNSIQPKETTLILNDGFIKNVDLYDFDEGPQSYIHWLTSLLNDFNALNDVDRSLGYPGVRAVLTYGQRIKISERDIETAKGRIITHPKNQEYYDNLRIVYSPNEFQMNTAFSKAYIMETMGSRAGLSGPNLYVDTAFLNCLSKLIRESKEAYYTQMRPYHFKKRNNNKKDESIEKMKLVNVPVSFEVHEYEEEELYIWEVTQSAYGKKEPLFKLWFDDKYVTFSEKGINTKLFRLIKYKPFDENVIIQLN